MDRTVDWSASVFAVVGLARTWLGGARLSATCDRSLASGLVAVCITTG